MTEYRSLHRWLERAWIHPCGAPSRSRLLARLALWPWPEMWTSHPATSALPGDLPSGLALPTLLSASPSPSPRLPAFREPQTRPHLTPCSPSDALRG